MKHTCGGPVFGRKTPGCPRCDELLAGSAPRSLPYSHRKPEPRHRHETCDITYCTRNEW